MYSKGASHDTCAPQHQQALSNQLMCVVTSQHCEACSQMAATVRMQLWMRRGML